MPPFRPAVAFAAVLMSAAPLLAAEPAHTPSVPPGDEFLRHLPKHFATLQAVDADRRRVTLLVDGEAEPNAWDLAPDAEVKVCGWWGRVEQLAIGDRVWAWFAIDRQKRPTAVAMLADEPSEQDIHGMPYTAGRAADGAVTLTRAKGGPRTLAWSGPAPPGSPVYVQTAGGAARLVLTPDQFEARRAEQKAWLRRHWLDKGLPATVTLLHPYSGEMELLLDHEAMRWARALTAGAEVAVQVTPPVRGTVRAVTPWRERTQLRLVVVGTEQAALSAGQRCRVAIPPPPAEVEASAYPPDAGRPRTKEERIEWVLASVYCTCGVAKDTCTGHFYTLASCNVNGCGLPAATRKRLAALIDEGKTDAQIIDVLRKERGPLLLKPHLLP